MSPFRNELLTIAAHWRTLPPNQGGAPGLSSISLDVHWPRLEAILECPLYLLFFDAMTSVGIQPDIEATSRIRQLAGHWIIRHDVEVDLDVVLSRLVVGMAAYDDAWSPPLPPTMWQELREHLATEIPDLPLNWPHQLQVLTPVEQNALTRPSILINSDRPLGRAEWAALKVVARVHPPAT